MTLAKFIKEDRNMIMAMDVLKKDRFWSAPNCSQIARYLDSKGFEGLAFVKTCGSKFGFMDDYLITLANMAFNQPELDELEIELDKIVTLSNRINNIVARVA